jgi:hypothetical protein
MNKTQLHFSRNTLFSDHKYLIIEASVKGKVALLIRPLYITYVSVGTLAPSLED